MFESVLAIIGGVIGLAILLGAAYAAFRASDLRATVKDQKARIDSLQTDRDELERDLQEERTRRELVEGRLALVEDRCGHLEEIVSGRIDFSALETALEHHHVEAVKRLDTLRADLTLALGDIKALLDARRIGDHQ